MPDKVPFTDVDLTNMVRGFDAPPKEDHLELLREQAAERENEREETLEPERTHEDSTELDALFRRKDEERQNHRSQSDRDR